MKDSADLKTAAGLFAFLALAFWHFRCRTFGPGDSGQHVLAALTWGVSRPPGYPLYDALGWLWTRLSWADPAGAVDGLSGIFAAASAALFFLLLRRQSCGRAAAVAAAGLAAFSPLLWFYSEVAEVRTLNNLLALTSAFFLFRWLERRRGGDAAAFGAAFGLGVSHHPTFILLAPAFAAAVWPVRKKMKKRDFGLAAGAAAAALVLPYAVLWARLRWGPPPAYNPDQVWSAFDVLSLFLRQKTGGFFNMFAHRRGYLGGISVTDLLRDAGWMGRAFGSGLGAAGVAAAGLGAAALWSRRRPLLAFWGLWAAFTALVFLVISSQQMPPLDPDYIRAVCLRFYLLPLLGLFGLAAFGLDALLSRARPALGWTLAAVALAAPLGFHPVDLRGHDWAKVYGERILADSGARDFVVLAADDAIVATSYLDVVENRAGDRVFLLPWLFNYPAYIDGLSRRHPDLKIPRRPDGTVSPVLHDWLAANPRRALRAEAVDAGPLSREFPFVGMRGCLAVALEKPQSAASLAREAEAFARSPLAAVADRDLYSDTQEIYLLKVVRWLRAAYGLRVGGPA